MWQATSEISGLKLLLILTHNPASWHLGLAQQCGSSAGCGYTFSIIEYSPSGCKESYTTERLHSVIDGLPCMSDGCDQGSERCISHLPESNPGSFTLGGLQVSQEQQEGKPQSASGFQSSAHVTVANSDSSATASHAATQIK